MAYPTNLDSFTVKVDGQDDILAAHINGLQSAMVAVETELGIGLRGSLADLATRLAVAHNNDGSLKTAAVVPGAGSITNSMLAANSVDSSKVQDGTLTGSDLAAATVTGSNIAAGTIGSGNIANLAIITALLADQSVTQQKLGVGAVYPDNMGLAVWNATGSTITAGQSVYVSGYNVANSLPQVSLAVNNTAGTSATFIATASIANGASGVVRRHWLSSANLNTGGSTVGNPVYLDSTAGGWTLTVPSASNKRVQVIGRVVVVDAAVGQIDFDLSGNSSTVVSSVDLAPGAVGTAQLSFAYTVLRLSIPMGTIATAAGTYEGIFVTPYAGTISGIHFVSSDALAASDTNYITLAGINKQGGAGSTALLTAVPTNTTKATGGQAVAAYTWNNLAGTGATCAVSDVLSFTATVTGTLANQLRNCNMVVTLVLS